MILNIGLNIEDAYGNQIGAHTVEGVLAALRDRRFPVRQAALHGSRSEPTLVVRTPDDAQSLITVLSGLYQLSEVLQQDCITVYCPTLASGRLIGPRAAKWGDFDPTQFLLLDGSYLAEGSK